ncbi:hypothetical protein [Psychroserpens algicola]|uniref:Uncharacterized protein n=1 Tax=Psychroserpens algicola TaxID=1719034 RepID=A0ABT0HC49_9FLAO|nr:hypothetical protein [Psychroserpens algicola]MCK8481901.1 hypothetical protein [Psychroserpens algicola]
MMQEVSVNRLLFKKDFIIALLVMSMPFTFYLYNLAPLELKIWKTSWFEINSGYYQDVNYFFWYLSVKFLTLNLLSIWYITCKYWWKYTLLISIIIEIRKILVIINAREHGFNSLPPYYESLGYSIAYILILTYISYSLGYMIKSKIYKLEVNKEINNKIIKVSDFKTSEYKKFNKLMKGLINEKSKMTKKEYLTKLISLRDQMTIKG